MKKINKITKSLSLLATINKDKGERTDPDTEEDDELDFKAIERTFGKSKFTIYPDHQLKTVWDLITFILIIYWSILLPF